MRNRMFRSAFLTAILLTALAGCGKSGNDDCTQGPDGEANAGFSSAGALTAAPLNAADYSSITALGNLQANGHPTPTDHMYFMLTTQTADSHDVFAAADSTVSEIRDMGSGEFKVTFKVDRSFHYYYDHIHLFGGLAEGQAVTAGQKVGTNSGLAAAVDFGATNHNITLAGFANTCRWAWELHADSPLKAYTGALATTLEGNVNRVGTDKDGNIDYDVAGELVGDWVKSGLAQSDMNTYAQYMAFVYDVVDPTQMRISIGGTLGTTGVYGVQGGAPDFKTITPASGKVAYQLYDVPFIGGTPSATQTGLLIVQMSDDSTVKLEFFAGGLSNASFDSSAFEYVR